MTPRRPGRPAPTLTAAERIATLGTLGTWGALGTWRALAAVILPALVLTSVSILVSTLVPATALAQQPPKLESLPPPPPPPPGLGPDSGDRPIEIGPAPNDKVEEIVVDGQRSLKVTTPGGKVYYMVPDPAENVGTRGPGTNLRVPKWVIKEF